MNFWKVYDIRMPERIRNFKFENKGRVRIDGGGIFMRKSVAYDTKTSVHLKMYFVPGKTLYKQKENERM